jgi:hypothetical protein
MRTLRRLPDVAGVPLGARLSPSVVARGIRRSLSALRRALADDVHWPTAALGAVAISLGLGAGVFIPDRRTLLLGELRLFPLVVALGSLAALSRRTTSPRHTAAAGLMLAAFGWALVVLVRGQTALGAAAAMAGLAVFGVMHLGGFFLSDGAGADEPMPRVRWPNRGPGARRRVR